MARLVRFIPWGLLASFVGLLAWSWFSEGIVHELLSGDLTAKQRVQRLKQFFRSRTQIFSWMANSHWCATR